MSYKTQEARKIEKKINLTRRGNVAVFDYTILIPLYVRLQNRLLRRQVQFRLHLILSTEMCNAACHVLLPTYALISESTSIYTCPPGTMMKREALKGF